ncbi:MAG: beta-galactosidase [Candidatus Limiplasma sp.]|nr:beta-galactosidase [Candidatus Limiplasma sp.]
MKKGWSRILHGGDYNPGQWPREIWAEDMRMLKQADINSATVNVFSWARIQPSEEIYDFAELDEIIGMLGKERFDIVLATSTGALPAWMVKRYPEVARTDYQGRRHTFGQRHNACPNSPVYQKYAAKLAGELARRYGANPHVVCWHVNNEYGGECYCENCEKAFRVWLRRKYKTLEALNKAWNLEFWGHTVYGWDEIVLPNALSEGLEDGGTAFAGISLDYCRFNSDSLLDNYRMERDAIRRFDPETPITTNMMGTYKGLDYFKWAREVDIVSWDNYPSYDTPWSLTAMRHDLMRGLKNAPFLLMEQTPSQQNWQPYNSLKKPNQMRAQSYQTLARGANTIQYFQLRRSVGGCEKFHGAVIEHAGTQNTRVFREVARLGAELKGLGDGLLAAENRAQVGILFDWDNYWALEYTSGPHKDLRYVEQIHAYYAYFYDRNIPVHMVPADADFAQYRVIVAPVLYMVKEGMAEALEAFVQGGGTLLTGFMSGIVDQSDNVHLGGYPGPLRKLAGVWAEEIDALAPEQSNRVRFPEGSEYACHLLCDLLHLEGAQALAEYASDFYSGMPALTRNSYGKGHVYYVGTVLEKGALYRVLDEMTKGAQVAPLLEEPTGLEVVRRETEEQAFTFVMNFRREALPLPGCFAGEVDALTGKTLEANEQLQPYDTCLIISPKNR